MKTFKTYSSAELISTVAGAGLLTSAPGTVGSAVACVLYMLVPAPFTIPVWCLILIVGTWASGRYEKEIGEIDPGQCVIDEVAGQWLALWGIVTGVQTAAFLLPGFLLFRLFDIIKPFPINKLEKLPGGYGIMADDLLAGVFANLCLRAVCWLFLQNGFARLMG